MSRAGRRALVAGLVVGAFALTLAACTGAPQADDVGSTEQGASDQAVAAPAESGAPDECGAAFPGAIGIPNEADVESLPADWPEPPAGSSLCLTASALGDGGESLSYVTEVPADAVLTHYEQALEGYTVSRELSPTGGEMLNGDGDTVAFQIRAGDGTIIIALRSAE